MTRRGALGRSRGQTSDVRPSKRSDGDALAPVTASRRAGGSSGGRPGSTPARSRRKQQRDEYGARNRNKVDLGAPRRAGIRVGRRYNTEAFGNFSETVARFIGTGRFLAYQSVFIAAWITWNVIFPGESATRDAHRLSFDPYPFQFLTLILSLQAAYAAPLILLAQNRQEIRDRRQSERDRQVATRTQADAEFITRELAAIRLALSDVATVDEVEKTLDRALDRAAARRDPPAGPPGGAGS